MNKVVIIASDDNCQVFINGTELQCVKELNINKRSGDFSEVTVTFISRLKTEEQK